ncbi:site-specific DNA-methyltransferase [Hyphomonadaceae bacterium ML37]|nr:site-specific DNA-methyltransferase [Hyphomonadaceae bacterium ML37]
MEKLKMHSPNLTDENIGKIRELFPGCVTEATDENGKLRYAVDFDQLRQELSDHVVEGPQERYRLDWPGKREALFAANMPIAKTLRPVRAESVSFDKTDNIFIEGDNLEALKLIQNAYLGHLKFIYIDPPYNRGDDLVYKDNFAEVASDYLMNSGQISDDQRFVANVESNGRFHSNWLSMMLPRLNLAKRLLREDGVIAISIDFNENHRLRTLCDEVFGRSNFLSEVTISTGANQSGDGVKIQKNAEICLIYAKDRDGVYINRVDTVQETIRNLNDAPSPLSTRQDMGFTIYYNPNSGDFEIRFDYDREKIPLNTIEDVYQDDQELIANGYLPIRPGFRSNLLHRWRWGAETVKARRDQLVFEKNRSGEWSVGFRQSGLNPPKNIWSFSGGATELSSLFDGDKIFDYPKGVKFLRYLITLFGTSREEGQSAIVMDFFAGSGSFAQAVFEQCADDGKHRPAIIAQFPEPLSKDNKDQADAFNTCIKNNIKPNIAEICKERMRRAGQKILGGECHPDWNKDVCFRVLKIDSSNMRDSYYTPEETDQNNLLDAVENVKPNRTDPEDLLFQVLVDWGVDLTYPIRRETISDKTVFFVNDEPYDLIACFDHGVTEELVKELANHEPARVVFRDNGFVSDAVKINVEQIFKQLSPATDVKSI